eukprot:CAMPEP_0169460554 /NCGR_PEP_ID=MMETSP1042-20121227/18553_1 /TAXON_ID=464988 /ORGANISM="Hemiselmis andersenii, Strain CCMP1180" /LENGTH=115 /DNA_ID=CAMNT_0009573061 /DNA_START=294 /DNA_END=641 /DNA_ORIENTATION=-
MRWAEAATGSSAALRLGEAHGVDLVGGGDASGAREADGTRLLGGVRVAIVGGGKTGDGSEHCGDVGRRTTVRSSLMVAVRVAVWQTRAVFFLPPRGALPEKPSRGTSLCGVRSGA